MGARGHKRKHRFVRHRSTRKKKIKKGDESATFQGSVSDLDSGA